jgi:hypothetical protein
VNIHNSFPKVCVSLMPTLTLKVSCA